MNLNSVKTRKNNPALLKIRHSDTGVFQSVKMETNNGCHNGNKFWRMLYVGSLNNAGVCLLPGCFFQGFDGEKDPPKHIVPYAVGLPA